MREARLGTVIGNCRLERVIGRGGMGVVYEAHQLRLDRPVALKLILPEYAEDDQFRQRFEQESRLAASLDHPNVVPIHEAGEQDGLLYIVMRLVRGTDLRSTLIAEGRLSAQQAVDYLEQIGAALDCAHGHGLVHRDVKPGNVLLEDRDGGQVAYLTDFGLTKVAGTTAGLTRSSQWVGTVDYVAPEQIEGKRTDARTDIYALGCVLYQAITGSVPFARDTQVARMWAHVNEPVPSVRQLAPHAPPELDAVIGRAMAKDPDDRYPSAGDLGRAARLAVEGEPLEVIERSVATGPAAPSPQGDADETRPARAERVPEPGSRRRPWIIAGALLAALVLGAAILGATGNLGGSDSRSDEPAASKSASGAGQPADAGTGSSSTGGAVSEGEAVAVMREYEAAYSSGSIPALSRILAPDVQVRADGQGLTFNRNDALESYKLQFADLRKSYEKWKYTILSNNLKGVGSKSTVASGSYRLTRFAPDGTPSVQEGPIELTFAKRNGRAVITVKDEPGR